MLCDYWPQAEARDQEIIGKDDRVTRLQHPGSNKHPGGLSVSLSTPLSHLLKPTLEKCEERSDDVLLLCAVVYRAHPGGPETGLPPSTEGLIKEEVKDGPVATSGDQGSGDGVIVVESDDDEGDQGPQDEPVMSVPGAEAASSGGISSANGGTLGGSPAAPHQTLPGASTPSLFRAVWEVVRRAATSIGKHGDDGVPGSSGRQNLKRSAHDRETFPVKNAETSGDDGLHLPSVVSRARPGGPEMRLPQRTEGLIKQEVKAEDGPVSTTSGDQEIDDGVIVVSDGDDDGNDDGDGDQGPQDDPLSDSDSDSEEDEQSQEDSDSDYELEEGYEEESQQSFRAARRTRATSGGGSSANGGASVGSPAAPPPTPEAGTASLSRAAREVVRSAAGSSTGKRKQPADDEGGPSCTGRQHLSRRAARRKGQTAAITDLPVNEDSQRRQENSTRDIDKANKKGCVCGRVRQPQLGLPGGIGRKDARWCSQCPSKPSNAVDVRSKRCECGSHNPTFGLPGGSGIKDARWCSQCPSKPINAVDVVSKRCECGSHSPTFGLPGGSGIKDAWWCPQCPSKPDNAVDVKNKRCECGRHLPTFGLPGGSGIKDARWCSQCPSKPNNAVNVVSKRCECGIHLPTFGLPGGSGNKDARWCSQCPSKPDDAVDVLNKQCECGSHRPMFGLPGTSGKKAARWCSQCASKPDNAVESWMW